MKKILITVSFLILASVKIYSFPYDMYTGMTGAYSLTGTLYIDNSFIGSKNNYSLSTPIVFNYGILRDLDIYARLLPINIAPNSGFPYDNSTFAGDMSIMPRYQIFNGFIAGLEFLIPTTRKQTFGINPQIHYLIGLGDFFSVFGNFEIPMYFGDDRGVVESVRLKLAAGLYPGSFFDFSLIGFLLEYHIAYDAYNKKMLGLNHLGVVAYLVLNKDASLSLNLSPYVEQKHTGYGFGIGASISYNYDFSRFVN